MPHAHYTAFDSLSVSAALILLASLYVRGWARNRRFGLETIEGWRAASFLIGLSFIWIALASPVMRLDHELLTAHMVQHLLLMTFGAPLIWLGAPGRPLLIGLPSALMYAFVHPAVRRPLQRIGRTLGRPAVCWCAATATLVGWHVPAAFTVAMQSHLWHGIELASFLVAGMLFWLPVIHARPDASASTGWSMVVYLFLATLPCDILSAFLVFSERVAYPIYLSTPRQSNLSVFDDQQLAGALMWTAVTIVYLTAGAILSARLLSPQGSARHAVESI